MNTVPMATQPFAARKTADLPDVSPRLVSWFARYLRRYFARNFDAVRVSGQEKLSELGECPLVLYANHPSWWDPILFVLLGQEYLPDRVGYGPMDAAALQKYRLLTRLGVFGVEQGSRAGAIEFLKTGESILRQPGTVLWITAEGEFTDPRRRPVRLRPGLSHLIRRVGAVTAIPVAVEYAFWNERLPEVLVRFGDAVEFEDGEWAVPTASINSRLEQGLASTMDQLAASVQLRDANEFSTLLHGSSGVGGIYDAWRRIVAKAQGKSFDASHGGGRS
jgi:1-acyl-sn-glycerol-3-phosphate acyltransferase